MFIYETFYNFIRKFLECALIFYLDIVANLIYFFGTMEMSVVVTCVLDFSSHRAGTTVLFCELTSLCQAL